MKIRFNSLFLSVALVLPVAAMVGGCAVGNTSIAKEDADSLQKTLIPGKTRKSDVLKWYGEPSEKAISNGNEVWTYRMVDTKLRTFIPFVGLAMGNNGTETTDVVVTFNKAGVVVRHDLLKMKG